jgi:hypothetical protein
MNVMPAGAVASATASVSTPIGSAGFFPPGIAAELLLKYLTHGRVIDAAGLRKAMTAAFGGSDAEGAWDWKTAYDTCEAATVLFVRKFGRGMRARAATPAALLGMLAKVAALLPSQFYQQFSTPIGYGFVASIAAAITADDLVLEPSAGTGLLAIFVELAGAGVVLNELAGGRADLLAWLLPGIPLTRCDAAHIDDHLDPALLRLFAPTGFAGPAILGMLMERFPLVRLNEKAAA